MPNLNINLNLKPARNAKPKSFILISNIDAKSKSIWILNVDVNYKF